MKCRIVCLCLLLFVFGIEMGFSQSVQEKVFERKYSDLKELDIKHRHGPINVRRSNDGTVKIKAVISIKGEKEDTDLFLERVNIEEDLVGESLTLNTDFNSRKWHSNNGRIRVTFQDGTKVNNLSNFKISYDIYVPELDHLKLQNKYHNITTESLNADVEVILYDSNLHGQDIVGNVRIENKYGEVYLGHVGSIDLKLYESKLTIEQAADVTLNQKYSKVKIEKCNTLEGISYDGKIETELIQGQVKLEDKYSEISLGQIGDATLKMYDGELQFEKAGSVGLTSKYTEYDIGQLTSLTLTSNYEDKFKISALNNLQSENSKYSNFLIGQLNNNIKLLSYEDEIEVGSFGSTLESINIESKYLKAELPLGDFSDLDIKLSGKYNKIDFEKDGFEVIKHIEKNSEMEFNGVKGTGNIKVLLNGYESKFYLK